MRIKIERMPIIEHVWKNNVITTRIYRDFIRPLETGLDFYYLLPDNTIVIINSTAPTIDSAKSAALYKSSYDFLILVNF
jgi:hypothetical protein